MNRKLTINTIPRSISELPKTMVLVHGPAVAVLQTEESAVIPRLHPWRRAGGPIATNAAPPFGLPGHFWPMFASVWPSRTGKRWLGGGLVKHSSKLDNLTSASSLVRPYHPTPHLSVISLLTSAH